MALVNCPECNENVSQKASVCPHCGYPMKPEEEPLQYELKKESPSDSHGASFMRCMAWIIWIGGLALAILSSLGSEAYGYYSSRTTFRWQNFFTVLGTYAIYGGLAWSVGLLFEDVHGIFNMLFTLKLIKKEKPKSESTKKKQPSAPWISSIANQRKISDTANQWECQTCGTTNDKNSRFCKDCGAYK